MPQVKRSQFASFLNVTPEAAATYARIGEGVTSGAINYNPAVTNETYIHEDNASISVDSYAPTLPIEQTAVNGDPVFEFVDALRRSRAVLADAETDMVSVDLYETPAGSEYPAEQQQVSIQIDTFGGDGGAKTRITYTINAIGDPVVGTFNPTTLAFTPAS
jgi:hypothetical protein